MPGALWIIARPRSLQVDLADVKAAGIDTVISLLEQDEARDLGLDQEEQTCATLGLTYLSHPIPDMQLPEPVAFRAFADDIALKLGNGARIGLHCRASIGRSGMLACTVLGRFGYDAPRALSHVSARRGVPVPDTAEQAAFITGLLAPTG